jgi:hypothetical protein
MKMVKHNGKMVPFFAADGKGSKDLKKAMYGMKMRRAEEGVMVGKTPKGKKATPEESLRFAEDMLEDTKQKLKALGGEDRFDYQETLKERRRLKEQMMNYQSTIDRIKKELEA